MISPWDNCEKRSCAGKHNPFAGTWWAIRDSNL
jgi:hypothetical protein